MAVADTYAILKYPGAGTTDTFAITWAYNATGDVLVYKQTDSTGVLTLLTVTTDYTITAAGDSGSVTLVAGNLASGYTLFIKREEAPKQETSWANSRSINVLNIEAADDKLTRLVQQHEETLERCFKVPINAAASAAGVDTDVTTCATNIAAIVAAPTEAAKAAQSAIDAAASAAGVDLPAIAAGDAYKLLRVKSDETGHELAHLASLLGRATSKSVAGSSNVDLTAAEAATPVIILTGALTGDINVTVPAAAGEWTVYNATTGDYAVTFKPFGGTGVVLDRGERSIIKCFSDASTMRELTRMQMVVGSVDIDLSQTGAQAVTGLAGRPTGGVFFGTVPHVAGQMSLALWGGTIARLIGDRNTVSAGTWLTGAGSMGLAYYAIGDSINQAYGSVVATADGFTLTRSKTGSPTGTFILNYMLFIA